MVSTFFPCLSTDLEAAGKIGFETSFTILIMTPALPVPPSSSASSGRFPPC